MHELNIIQIKEVCVSLSDKNGEICIATRLTVASSLTNPNMSSLTRVKFHIGLITMEIPLKLFLEMEPSSSADFVTTRVGWKFPLGL